MLFGAIQLQLQSWLWSNERTLCISVGVHSQDPCMKHIKQCLFLIDSLRNLA